ncbi:hypothetical protein HNR77_004518 [Paenibacillus sp. JGP012]|nr:hypothetical protein [Paenibacillus sp. JGP012]
MGVSFTSIRKIKIEYKSQNKQSVKGIQYNCYVSVWGSKHESAEPLEYNVVGVGVTDPNSKEPGVKGPIW